MLTRDNIITMLNRHYTHLATEYAVKRIGVFGSYATDSPCETSDIDLVIEFDRPIGFKFMELYNLEIIGEATKQLSPAVRSLHTYLP